MLRCPSCDATTATMLDNLSEGAVENHYRCPACGHVWTLSKRYGSIATHGTPVPAAKAPRKKTRLVVTR